MIRLEQVHFGYGDGGFALEIDALHVARRSHVACIGPSGSGKTTLVNLIAGILLPDRGRVELAGRPISELGDAERRAQRIGTIGMMFQQFELLDYLTARDNILLPYHVSGALALNTAVRSRADEIARALRIEHTLARRPARLSQGERQRVAIARALVTEPELVICDEPTGNLDPETARVMLDLLFEQVRSRDATLLMVTHDHGTLQRFDEVLDMREFGVVRSGAAKS